jgi:hypothetical protein
MICGNDIIVLNPGCGADLLASNTFLLPLRVCLVSFLKPWVRMRSRLRLGFGFGLEFGLGSGLALALALALTLALGLGIEIGFGLELGHRIRVRG